MFLIFFDYGLGFRMFFVVVGVKVGENMDVLNGDILIII